MFVPTSHRIDETCWEIVARSVIHPSDIAGGRTSPIYAGTLLRSRHTGIYTLHTGVSFRPVPQQWAILVAEADDRARVCSPEENNYE